jgi:hypothetical protein
MGVQGWCLSTLFSRSVGWAAGGYLKKKGNPVSPEEYFEVLKIFL